MDKFEKEAVASYLEIKSSFEFTGSDSAFSCSSCTSCASDSSDGGGGD